MKRKPGTSSWFRMTVIALMDRLRKRGWFGGDSWAAWRVVLQAMFALPLDEAEQATFTQIGGGRRAPEKPVREAWFVVGRRGGKSLIAALLALFYATCVRYRLAPGEKGVIMIVAADRRQARVIFRYLQAFFEVAPFASLVERQTQEAIVLTNGLVIEIHTASFRSVRGYTVVCAILDEIAFWSVDGANPDEEILTALRPAMATIPQAILVALSSPYARRGQLWEQYRKCFGKDSDDVLVIQAPSRTMNPSLPEAIVAKAYEADEAAASAEFGAQFRSDIEAFVRREAVEACVVPGRFELAPAAGLTYLAGFDAAGGSGTDEMTLAISHVERQGERVRAVLDLVVGIKPPFSPEQGVADFCAILTRYRIARVQGDRYAGEWPREQFTKAGIEYQLTDKSKSGLYRELLPAINSGSVELLDEPRMLNQLCALERRTARGGRDIIDHPPNGKDDLINAAAIALLLALREGGRPQFDICAGSSPSEWSDSHREQLIDKETTPEGQVVDSAVMYGLRSGGGFGFR